MVYAVIPARGGSKLKEKGFIVMPQNTSGVLQLKVSGLQRNAYFMFINHLTGG
jgi:hypothetical protein